MSCNVPLFAAAAAVSLLLMLLSFGWCICIGIYENNLFILILFRARACGSVAKVLMVSFRNSAFN